MIMSLYLELANEALELVEETVIYKLDRVILDNDDGVLQSVKHELELFFVFQLFIDLMQKFVVDLLNQHQMHCKANNSNNKAMLQDEAPRIRVSVASQSVPTLRFI